MTICPQQQLNERVGRGGCHHSAAMASKKQPNPVEYSFLLPRGLTDQKGRLHRKGVMRLATAKDEIDLTRDRRVQENPAYEILVRLSQVVTRLGSLSSITPQQLENLVVLDLSYLREFYHRINQDQHLSLPVECPHCQSRITVELSLLGEYLATP